MAEYTYKDVIIDPNDLKHPGVPIGVLLAIDIGILIILFLGLFGVFG